jgi:hypothetical protein
MKARSPLFPWVLGLAGLIPFVVLLAASQLAPAPYDGVSAGAWTAYAAIILSFLGGTRWGAEIIARGEAPSAGVLVVSVLPSLAGWIAVVLTLVMPAASFAVLAVGFAGQWLWDTVSSGQGPRRLPVWYPPLRTVLTLVVLACTAAMAWFTLAG